MSKKYENIYVEVKKYEYYVEWQAVASDVKRINFILKKWLILRKTA